MRSRSGAGPAPADRLFTALAEWRRRPEVVRDALELLEAAPLASAGHFRGDLLRRLMDLPSSYWARQPAQYARYRAVVRAAALLRRALPEAERHAFWGDLPPLPRGDAPGDAPADAPADAPRARAP
ncbi:MAG TPA: hypothetical protein VFS40_05730 [Gemmatimonadales bacterium]|nr:hypothetical protein [Gemmatimonadales bacterium]